MNWKKALIERAMDAELSHPLGHSQGGGPPAEHGNRRNESPRLSRRLQELGESESWDAKVGFHRRFANAQFAS